EYGETAPFLYFMSHTDAELSELVRKGRTEEFKSFGWAGEPPDPNAEATFEASKLNWALLGEDRHRRLLGLYRELIRLRRELPSPAARDAGEVDAWSEGWVVFLNRRLARVETLAVWNVGAGSFTAELPPGSWTVLLDSSAQRWGGPTAGAEVAGGAVEVRADAFVLLSRPGRGVG
ncbi:MAG: DUF3459 domain-containing protein, partial [Actinomycetota bacterium]